MDFEEGETIFVTSYDVTSNEDSGVDNGTLSDSSSTSCETFQLNVEHNETLHEITPSHKFQCCKSAYNISGLEIKTISGQTFAYMASYIKHVNLSNNKIACLPGTLGALKNLEDLDLSRNVLFELPESMKNLRKLKLLNISGNKFTNLPSCIENGMDFIKVLDLSDNKIENLPSEPSCLPRLQCLKIRNNNLLSIPMWLFGDKCRSLIELDVSFNFCFDSTTKLKLEIQLSKHHRSSALKVLKVLNVSNTGVNKERLTYLDEFEKLEVLHMGNTGAVSQYFNTFTDIPIELFCNPSTIVDLVMSKVGLASVSDSITKLKHLKVLNLAENEIQWLPDCFSSLNTLEELVLSKCKIIYLPTNFNKLSNLKKLLLDHNQLAEVSQHLKGLESLEWLDLYDNLLEEFPISVKLMSALKKLDVAQNCFNIQESLIEKKNGVYFCQLYHQLQSNLRSSLKFYLQRTDSFKVISNDLNDTDGSSDSVISHSPFHHHRHSSDSSSSYTEQERDDDYVDSQTGPFVEEEEECWCESSSDEVDLTSIRRQPLVSEHPLGMKHFGWKPPYSSGNGLNCSVPTSQKITGFIFVPADTHLKPRTRRKNVRDVPSEEHQFSDEEVVPVVPERRNILNDIKSSHMFRKHPIGPQLKKWCRSCNVGEDCWHIGVWIKF